MDVDAGALRMTPSLVLAGSAFFAGIVLAGVLGAVAIAATGDQDGPALLVASFVGLWIPLVGAAILASYAFGTRSPGRDLGWSLRREDLWIGLAVGVIGLLAATAVQLALSPFEQLTGTNTNFIEEQTDTIFGTIAVVASTLLGAPIIEELFFRGLVQHALARLRTFAIVLQAFIFGLIHVTPEEGLGNVGIVSGVAALALVLGFAVRRYGRLGPAIIGHMVFNAAAVVPILLSS